MIEFEVTLRGPLDVAGSVERFRRWGDDLIDRWDGGTLLRVACDTNERRFAVACVPTGAVYEPKVRVVMEPAFGAGLAEHPIEAEPAGGHQHAGIDSVDGAEQTAHPPFVILSEAKDRQPTARTSRSVSPPQANNSGLAMTLGPAPGSVAAQPQSATTLATQAVRDMFVQAPSDELEQLMARDPVIAQLEVRYRGIRPVLERDPLTALVQSISAQQVNLRWAAETRRRLVTAFGDRHQLGGQEVWSLSAERLAEASVAAIRELQFTTRKAEYIVGVARRVAADARAFAGLAGAPDEEVIAFLTSLAGIGRWTAEWYLARTLGRPAVVAGDLGVRKAVGRWYFDGRLPSEAEVRQATAHWGSAAGVAQQLLLESLVEA